LAVGLFLAPPRRWRRIALAVAGAALLAAAG